MLLPVACVPETTMRMAGVYGSACRGVRGGLRNGGAQPAARPPRLRAMSTSRTTIARRMSAMIGSKKRSR